MEKRGESGKVDVLIKWKKLDELLWESMEIIKKNDPNISAGYTGNNGIHKKAV